MPVRPREVELVVERPTGVDPNAERVRLVARFEVSGGTEGPSPQELTRALDRLRADLDVLVGPSLAAAPIQRPDRELPELVETYRPRQRELVDLLRDEGEISTGEHGRLVEYLALPTATRPAPPPSVAVTPEPPLAAAPILSERLPDRARPVPELLQSFQITTLRQAGAVRARRQISFEEYMALKRHFETTGDGSPALDASRSTSG